MPRGDDPQRAGSVDLMVSSGDGAEDTASEAIVFRGVENIAKGDYVEKNSDGALGGGSKRTQPGESPCVLLAVC